MNQAKINELKAASDAAHLALNAEQARLTAEGFKSKQRYVMLKDLKASADLAHAEYAKYTKGQISHALDKIIAVQTPAQRAEGLRRARAC
jgi:hypothetical protein